MTPGQFSEFADAIVSAMRRGGMDTGVLGIDRPRQRMEFAGRTPLAVEMAHIDVDEDKFDPGKLADELLATVRAHHSKSEG